jgi:thymidylate synthase
MHYRNASAAFKGKLADVMARGDLVTVRGRTTRELRQQTITLDLPLERAIVVPHRRNNIFATIAETMWVMAGRDDVAYLEPYLPRALDYSDDGVTWRGAYGPRLRNWQGIDQVAQVSELLRREPSTRRAVMSLFDPARDFSDSLDIPCTNWLHFTVREGLLDLSVTVRSNDLFWGFSGINTFEWSVLQEMVAFWTQTIPGRAHYFISSLHVYERHWGRAHDILASEPAVNRNPQSTEVGRFSTPQDDFPEVIASWFKLEEEIRSRTAVYETLTAFPDPLLRDFLLMLNAFWAFQTGSNVDDLLDDISDFDLCASALNFFAWRTNSETRPPSSSGPYIETGYLRAALTQLHASKNSVYGDSWKKRGEQMSVLANIARKVDRLVIGGRGAVQTVEPELDNAADLVVYAVKYETFILDAIRAPAPASASKWSDGLSGFEDVMSRLTWRRNPRSGDLSQLALVLDQIEQSIGRNEKPERRQAMAHDLAEAALQLFFRIVDRDAPAAERETRSWMSEAAAQL